MTITLAEGSVYIDGGSSGGTITSATLVSPTITGTTRSDGVFYAASGAAAAPAYSFSSAPTTGVFLNGTSLDLAAGGSSRMSITTNSVNVTTNIRTVTNGSAGVPSHGFTGDIDCGMYLGGSNVLGFATGGVERMSIGSAGGITFPVTLSANGVQVMTSAGLASGGLRFDNITSGAAAQAATLLNSPVAGDPTFWIAVIINGTLRYIPAW